MTTMINPGDTNLVAFWKMNESSGSRLDSHGSNVLVNYGCGWDPGRFNGAAAFDGSDGLGLANNSYLNMSGQIPFSGGVWVQPGNATSNTTSAVLLFTYRPMGASWRQPVMMPV